MRPIKAEMRQTARPPTDGRAVNAVNADRHTDSHPGRARRAGVHRRAKNQTCVRAPFRQKVFCSLRMMAQKGVCAKSKNAHNVKNRRQSAGEAGEDTSNIRLQEKEFQQGRRAAKKWKTAPPDGATKKKQVQVV